MNPTPTPDPWLILSAGACAPADNMAWDEALLEFCGTLGASVLRLYGWTEPAATFGYFQHYEDIAKATALRPLIRRPTGGGLVPHDADWTYSIAVPSWHDWYSLKAEQSYERAHLWVQSALGHIGVEATLAPCCREEQPGQCFAGYVKHDVLRHGRKIAGAAQRRNKLGLLIQGSLQPPAEQRARRHAWEAALLTSATADFGAAWQPLIASEELKQRVAELAETKYRRDDFNRRR